MTVPPMLQRGGTTVNHRIGPFVTVRSLLEYAYDGGQARHVVDMRLTGLCLLAFFGFVAASPPNKDHQHDFDFEMGKAWHAHLQVLQHPLSGSHTWTEYDGTSVVRKIWDGRANLGEFNVGNATSKIQGLSLRLYHPQTGQWSVYWANSNDGALTTPLVGNFTRGIGEFYSQDSLNGKAIFVRFIFSGITAASFRLEQAFSADGGKTWETNWIADFSRSVSKTSGVN